MQRLVPKALRAKGVTGRRRKRPLLGRKADVHVSVLNSRLGGAKLAYIRHLRLVRSRIPDRDAAEREVDMFIPKKMDA